VGVGNVQKTLLDGFNVAVVDLQEVHGLYFIYSVCLLLSGFDLKLIRKMFLNSLITIAQAGRLLKHSTPLRQIRGKQLVN
jgi:hypothetical protein